MRSQGTMGPKETSDIERWRQAGAVGWLYPRNAELRITFLTYFAFLRGGGYFPMDAWIPAEGARDSRHVNHMSGRALFVGMSGGCLLIGGAPRKKGLRWHEFLFPVKSGRICSHCLR